MKSEIRNPKSERNPRAEVRTAGRRAVANLLRATDCGLLSDFGFRISSFALLLIASLLAPSVRAQGPGLALDFNGTNAYLVSQVPLGSPNLATGSAPHTVEGWIRPAGLPAAGTRQWALQLGNDLAAHLWLWNGDGTCTVGMWAGVGSSVRLTPGAWNHVAAAFDGATLHIYLNGVLVASPAGAFNLQGIPLTLGRGNPAGGGGANERYFAGRLDELRLWNVARTAQQIQANFNRPLAGNEPGLAAYYRLDDGPGAIAADATGHGYIGSLTNTASVPSSIPWVGAISGWLTAGSAGLPNFAIAATPAGDVVASEFFSDFSATPAGMTLVGSAIVNGGYLKLTPAVIAQNSAAAFNDFSLGAPIQRFRATFKASVFGGSSPPADGFSFSFVPATATNLLGGEEGLPDGLAVSFDTFDSGGGEAPAVDVRWRGTNIGHVAFMASQGPGVTDPVVAARDVVINLDADGTMDVSYGTNILFTNLATPYVPIAGGKWVFGARTGGSRDNHWIDDLRIQVFAMPQTNATDVAGNYRLDSLPYGSNYVVQPVQPGWFFSPSMVTTNSGATNVNFVMNTVIRGRVTAGAGGLAGATVQAVSLLDASRVATNVTDASGNFAINLTQLGTNVPPLLDDYTVSVRYFNTTPASLTAHAGGSNVNFTATSGTLAGRVTLGSNALAGVTVRAVSTTNSALVFTTTADANGNFSFVGVALGSYTITLPGYTTTPPSVSANAGSANLNFAVANQTIAGRVTAGASGVGGVKLDAVRPTLANGTPTFIPDLGSITQAISVTATSTVGLVRVGVDIVHTFAGDLELTLVHPDGTQVRLRDSDGNDDTEDVLTSYPDLTPAVGNLTELDGKPMNGAWRLIVRDQFAEDSGTLNSWTLTLGLPPVTTATNGTYGFTNIEVSAYTVTPTRPNSSFTPPFREVPTAATNVDFTMGTTFIAGRVTDGAFGLAGVTILVEGPHGPAGSAVTDSTGRYLALGLPPDTYSVIPFLYGYSFHPSWTNGIIAGVSNINFSVVAYPIAGRITDLNGDPVPDVFVDGGVFMAGHSDANGNYAIPNVTSGSNYVVTPFASGFAFSPATRLASVGPAASNVNFAVLQSPPTVSAISNRVILRNSSTGPVRFTVGDRETRAGLLQVTASVSDTNLLPRVELGGVGSERLVTVYSTNLTGTGSVTVAVSDGVATTTRSFLVRVNTEPLAGVGTALSFDGVNDFAQVNTNVVPSKGDFTVECWLFAPATTNQTRRALAQGNTNGSFSIGYDSQNRVAIGTVWANPGVPFPFDAWHHFAVVKAGSNAFLYLDGALAATRGSTLAYPPQPGRFYMGSQYGGTNQFWRGMLDELRVWRVARTPAQIVETMNARVLGTEPGLTDLWRFDEGAGLLALDRTTNAHHGALSNGVGWVQADVIFDRYVVPEDNAIADTLTGFDPDGDPLTYELNGPPAKGTLTLNADGSLLYIPNRDATGPDSFAFRVNDGFADSSLRVINIFLQPDTNAPSISSVPDQLMTEDTVLGPIEFDIADLETAASNLTVTATSSNPILVPNALENLALGGTGATRTLTIAPATNQFGTAFITLVVSDGRLTASNTFVLTVTNVNDAPTITALTNQLTRRGVTAMQAFTVGDVDNDPASLTVTAVTSDPILVSPANITFSGSGANRTVSVTPSQFASGQTAITLRVNDGQTNASASFVITVNNPPSFAALSFTNLIAFPGDSVTNVVTVDDVDTPNLATLALSAATSDEDLVPAANIVISVGAAPNERRVVVRPAGLISGLETVTLTLSDGIYQTNAQFTITYRASGPVYELVELNVGDSLVEHVNDRDQVIGTFLTYNTLFNGWLWETGHVTVITPPPSVIAALGNDIIVRPFGINNNGVVVGGVGGGLPWWSGSGISPNYRAFQFENGVFSLLNSPCGGNALATDINEAGFIAGMLNCGGVTAGYWRNAASAMVSIPQAVPGTFYARSFRPKVSINDQNRIAIGGTAAGGDSFYDIGPAVNTPIGFAGAAFAFEGYQGPGDINDGGLIFGTTRAGRFFTYSTTTRTTSYLDANPAWGPMNAAGSEARRINDAGDMLGGPVFLTGGTGPNFAIIGGEYYTPAALLNLVPASQRGWVSSIFPSSINNIGTIVGNAVRTNGPTAYSAFLMKPAVWYIGRPISPPLNYLSVQPYVTVPDGNSARYFFWSPAEGALYPLGPVTASVIWRESANPADTNGFTQIITTAWPPSYQAHVATAPVDLDPLDPQSPWAFSRVAFSTIDGLTATPNENVFQPNFPAFSVIQYLRTEGATPNPLTQSNFFQIVRTIAWNDPNYLLDNQPAIIGTKVTDPFGVTALPLKSGWVVNERARHDGVGDDRAHDRATQTGPIIPVNLSGTDPDTQLVVAYYHTNRLGVLWADKPVRYFPQWPVNPEKIVTASQQGSGPLHPALYTDVKVYQQPDANLAGYNPNEEHAVIFPANGGPGDAIFALRDDLNAAFGNLSPPFALLKYHTPGDSEWKFKVFAVVAEDATYQFQYAAEAGKEILPPYPLGLLTLCPDNTRPDAGGPWYTNHLKRIFARSGDTPNDPNATVTIRYFYPLQPDFYFNPAGGAANALAAGTCIPWLNQTAANLNNTPQPVRFRVHWPEDAPVLEAGRTLFNASQGLPEVRRFARGQVIYDSLNPELSQPSTLNKPWRGSTTR